MRDKDMFHSFDSPSFIIHRYELLECCTFIGADTPSYDCRRLGTGQRFQAIIGVSPFDGMVMWTMAALRTSRRSSKVMTPQA